MFTACIAYIPVLHEGYRQFLVRQPIDLIWLLSKDFVLSMADVDEFNYLHKDLRHLDVKLVKTALDSWQVAKEIEIAGEELLREFATQVKLSQTESHDDNTGKTGIQLLLPNEDISRVIVDRFFAGSEDNIAYSPIFLRWDKHTATAQYEPNVSEISADHFAEQMVDLAYRQALNSTDWWRQVGGVLVKDGKPLLTAFNRHLPDEQEPYLNGDVRSLFHKGDHIELNSAIHAEAALIAEAAKKGLSIQGASLYLTTFPCPVCAKLVANAGIKSVYFTEGYAMLDGETILQSADVLVKKVIVSPSIRKSESQNTSTPVHYS